MIAALLWLLPPLAIGAVLVRGFRPAPLIGALLRRYAGINAIFAGLIAVAIAMSVSVSSVERALRDGSARAAEKFDLVVGAPGSELALLFSSVFAQPANIPLLDGDAFNAVADSAGVTLAAPLGFGDSHEGVPIIGTTQAFVNHLGGGEVSEGRGFETPFDVIAGALHPITIGESFEPAHGFGAAVVEGLHGDVLTVVGRMPATGSPWDHVLVTPIEGVWMTHGLASGHAPGNERLGPPYDARFFPGTPAVVVVPESLSSAYRLRNTFNSDPALMAIFPGTELIELYSVLGDVRQVMAALARLTQGIIAVGVLTALFILLRLFAQQLNLLAVLGAPDRFRLAVIWGYAGALLTVGTVAGLGLGGVSALVIGRALTAETNIAIAARMGWGEVANAAAFLTLSLVVALATSALGLRRLRGSR